MSEREVEAELTLKDRLNFPYLLAKAIIIYQESKKNPNLTDDEAITSVKSLINIIPTTYRDDSFKEDLDKASVDRKIDTRPEFCGIKASEKFCKEHGIKTFENEKVNDPDKLVYACINLLERRGFLARKSFTEKLTGRPATKPGEDLATSKIEEI